MALKDWLNSVKSASSKGSSKGPQAEQEMTIDDLITLEKYEEAITKLKKRISSRRNDYRARIQLADVYLKTGKGAEAIAEYLAVADRYSQEGFFDKAHALVAKLSRMVPHEEKLQSKMASLERAKRLEHRRRLVIQSLGTKGWALEVRQHWADLIRGPIIEVLSNDQLQRLFPLLQMQRLKEGEQLVERGQQRNELFLILTGELAAQMKLASGSQADLRVFKGGDIVGDQALMKRSPWPAAYRAKKATKLLKLTREALEQSLVGEEDPRGFLNVLRIQSHDEEIAEAASKVKTAEPE